jgi:hypothetical protein
VAQKAIKRCLEEDRKLQRGVLMPNIDSTSTSTSTPSNQHNPSRAHQLQYYLDRMNVSDNNTKSNHNHGLSAASAVLDGTPVVIVDEI